MAESVIGKLIKTKEIDVTLPEGAEGYVSLANYGVPQNCIVIGIKANDSSWIHARIYSNYRASNCRLTAFDSDTGVPAGTYKLVVAYIDCP